MKILILGASGFFCRKVYEKLIMQNNNEELIYEDIINEEYAEINGIHLDTSMNTGRCRKLFTTYLGMYSHKEDNNENISTYRTISNNI